MRRQESSTVGVRSVSFALGVEDEGDPEKKVDPFLEICCRVGSDRTRQARQENRFILYADSTTIYTAEFLDSDWDCGLTQEELGEMDCPCFLPLNRTLSLVRQAGGLLFQAHPFREYLRCMPAACMDGVGGVNANPRHDSHNDRALAFARENGLLRVAGSDVHQLGDAGAAGILAPYARDGKALAELLRQGRHRCFQRERGVERRV